MAAFVTIFCVEGEVGDLNEGVGGGEDARMGVDPRSGHFASNGARSEANARMVVDAFDFARIGDGSEVELSVGLGEPHCGFDGGAITFEGGKADMLFGWVRIRHFSLHTGRGAVWDCGKTPKGSSQTSRTPHLDSRIKGPIWSTLPNDPSGLS